MLLKFTYPYELVDVPAQIIEVNGRLIELSRGWRLRLLGEDE